MSSAFKTVQLLGGVALVVTAWIQVSAADNTILVRQLQRARIPFVYMVPDEALPAAVRDMVAAPWRAPGDEAAARAKERAEKRAEEGDDPAEAADEEEVVQRVPAVLLAHGFAGSKQLMLGYAHVLAHSGYAVLLWDFDGHGANARRFDEDSLRHNLDQALRLLDDQTEVDTSRIALLGHSMGARAVLRAAAAEPDRFAAVVGVSPPEGGGLEEVVTPAAPPNLQLQAGSWEPEFLASAQHLLTEAGGPSDRFAAGTARELVVVPWAEHLSIVARDESHRAVVEWLNEAFAAMPPSPDASTDAPATEPPTTGAPATDPRTGATGSQVEYRDRRMMWYAIQVFGFLLVLGSLAPVTRGQELATQAELRWPMYWAGMLLGPVAAGVTLLAVSRAVDPLILGPVAGGGALALWMLVAGGTWMLFGARLLRPRIRDVLWGLFLFAFLWAAIGGLAHQAWMNWSLTPTRLLLWPVFAAACVPWFLAAEATQGGVHGRGRIAWWLGQSAALVGGLVVLQMLVPSLTVLVLLAPLLPPLLAVFGFAGSRINRPWSYGLGCALVFGWMIAAAFPVL